MLKRVQFCNGVPISFEICNKCKKNDGLLAISDGSVIFHNTSYGWVVATPNGGILT